MNKKTTAWFFINFLALLCFATGCSQKTDAPHSKVIQMRNSLLELTQGKVTQLTGNTAPDESYILFYGYSDVSSLKSLPISDNLRSELEDIYPTKFYERYVLAHVVKDEIQEYTEWEHTHEYYHSVLVRTPFMVKGNPYKISKELDKENRMTLNVTGL